MSWLTDALDADGVYYIDPGADGGDMGELWGVLVRQTTQTPAELAANHAAHLHLSADGAYTLLMTGPTALGPGAYRSLGADGAARLAVIAADNDTATGAHRDGWPYWQYHALVNGAAAILRSVGEPATHCIGHREWNRDNRDPNGIRMGMLRGDVATRLLYRRTAGDTQITTWIDQVRA